MRNLAVRAVLGGKYSAEVLRTLCRGCCPLPVILKWPEHKVGCRVKGETDSFPLVILDSCCASSDAELGGECGDQLPRGVHLILPDRSDDVDAPFRALDFGKYVCQ